MSVSAWYYGYSLFPPVISHRRVKRRDLLLSFPILKICVFIYKYVMYCTRKKLINIYDILNIYTKYE